jgi:hypothetical protein
MRLLPGARRCRLGVGRALGPAIAAAPPSQWCAQLGQRRAGSGWVGGFENGETGRRVCLLVLAVPTPPSKRGLSSADGRMRGQRVRRSARPLPSNPLPCLQVPSDSVFVTRFLGDYTQTVPPDEFDALPVSGPAGRQPAAAAVALGLLSLAGLACAVAGTPQPFPRAVYDDCCGTVPALCAGPGQARRAAASRVGPSVFRRRGPFPGDFQPMLLHAPPRVAG